MSEIQVNQSFNLSPLIYRVWMVQEDDWYRVEEAEISAPNIRLYFNNAKQIFSVTLRGIIELSIERKCNLEAPYVTHGEAELIRNHDFVELWRHLKCNAPLNEEQQRVVEDMLWALETLVKASH